MFDRPRKCTIDEAFNVRFEGVWTWNDLLTAFKCMELELRQHMSALIRAKGEKVLEEKEAQDDGKPGRKGYRN